MDTTYDCGTCPVLRNYTCVKGDDVSCTDARRMLTAMPPVGEILAKVFASFLVVCECCGEAHKGPRTICDDCATTMDTVELTFSTCRCCGKPNKQLNGSDECAECEARILV